MPSAFAELALSFDDAVWSGSRRGARCDTLMVGAGVSNNTSAATRF